MPRVPATHVKLRSRLAATPATVNHLTAETRAAELNRRLVESFGSMSPWGWPQLWQAYQFSGYPGPGGFPYRGASGTTNDRAYGRDLPFFWSEVDLRGYRVMSRFIAETNPFAIGFCNLLVGYHVRKGFGWQCCRKGAAKTAYPTLSTNDELVKKGQHILDTFRDENHWPVLSREAFWRWRVDGEVFLRLGCRDRGQCPWARLVDPEQIGAPDGSTTDPWAYGIDVLEYPDGALDPATVLAYHVWQLESGMTAGEWVDARYMVHAKANVAWNVKRGRPDFFPLFETFDHVAKLVHNMLLTAVDLAAVAWIEKFPSATQAQIIGVVPQQVTTPGQATPVGQSPGPWPGWPGGWGGPGNGNRFRPGSLVRMEGSREIVPNPGAPGAAAFELVEKLAIRSARMRWNLPGSASGDAEDTTFAAAIQAGGPFPVAVEGSQLVWGASFERPAALKVLDLAVEAGLLSPAERAQLDVEITAPAVVTPEPDKDTQRRQTLNAAKVLSITTWQLQEGLDPQHEAANFAAESRRLGTLGPTATPPGSAGGDGSSPNAGDLFGTQESQSGIFTDKNGHRYRLANGKRVPLGDEPGKDAAKQTASPVDTKASPKRTQSDPEEERFKTTRTGRVLIDADVQRWAEAHNEPAVAKEVGGGALPDNEPMDVLVPPPPDTPQHGLELKTMVANKARHIHMKPEAQARKRKWRRENKAPVHTVVIDDTEVFNANGPGQHDLSKRRVFYRRGFGSFKVDGMFEVPGGMAGLKELLTTPTKQLPPGAWKPKPKTAKTP